jgi:chemotaxis protein methyltransferase WspC
MSRNRFEELLERTLGLHAASIGTSAVERGVNERARACKLAGDDAYWEFLQRSPDELQELIETVVVPETWFFRDPEAFATMARIVAEGAVKCEPSRLFRLLSLPCSTGEEPYTMAMALLDAGLPASRFRIDAIDISLRALAKARLGTYGRNSFRSRDLGFRDRYFELGDGGYRLIDAVRAPVHFSHGNIMDPSFMTGAETYDVIFCRNLLIYFDAPLQARAVTQLSRLLTKQGVLFVGHSETGLMQANGFASLRLPMAFAFRKAAAQSLQAAPAPAPLRLVGNGRPSASPSRPRVKTKTPVALQVVPARAEAGRTIEDLRRIADAGEVQTAAEGCEAFMRDNGPSAEAFLLLGLIRDATGDAGAAANYYRKALYLDPANSEALGHLALLLRRQGDHASARLLDERMRRQDGRRSR